MQTICQEEAEKMQTFSLLHYEKPSTEKKITGYSSIAKSNKPNPAYTSPELGGSNDDSVNPKSLLMSDPNPNPIS